MQFKVPPLEIQREIVARIETERAKTLAGTCPQVDTFKWEAEIDQLVAPRQLYGLTKEEIDIVEGVK